jgi:hypothetical protein
LTCCTATYIQAIEGVRSLNPFSLRLVELKEMPSVLEVPERTNSMVIGGWARVKNGIYRGDLVQVFSPTCSDQQPNNAGTGVL